MMTIFLDEALESVATEYQLRKFCKEQLCIIESIQHTLGRADDGKLQSFQYIPVLKVITELLQQEDIWSSVNRRIVETLINTDDADDQIHME